MTLPSESDAEPFTSPMAVKSDDDEALPVDKGGRLYATFFLLGVGTLLPWNTLITAVDYFAYLYPGEHVDRLLSVCYMLPNLTSMAILVRFSDRTIKPFYRVLFGLCVYLAVLFIVPGSDMLRGEIVPSHRGSGLTILCICTAFTGIADSNVQGSLVGMATMLPPKYMQAFISGTAQSGVIVSALRILTKGSISASTSGLRTSAYLYFVVAAVVIFACIVVFLSMTHSKVFEHYAHTLRPTNAANRSLNKRDKYGVYQRQIGDPNSELRSLSSEVENVNINTATVANEREGEWYEQTVSDRESLWAGGIELTENSHLEMEIGECERGEKKSMEVMGGGRLRVDRVMFKIWRHLISVCLIYVVTLAIFPGFLTEDVESAALGDWYPIVLIAAFNVADLLGKMMKPSQGLTQDGGKRLLMLAVSRLLFMPLFGACTTGPEILRHEAVIFVLTFTLGLSSGWLCSAVMMTAPSHVGPHEGECAGNLLVFFLLLGLAIGAVCGCLWLLI